MEPINSSSFKKEGCVTTSSNCVIWQGPDISCINLCKGDSISDVTHKLAIELCDIMDQLSISNYDLSCLELGVTPANFNALIQLLITKICNLENIDPVPGTTAGCPDCVVPVATCLQTTNPITQNLITTMQLTDYVQLIGNKVCDIVSQISEINDTLVQNTTDIESLNDRVTSLENSSTEVILPDVNINCINGVTTTPINQAVEQVAETVCILVSSVGENEEILNSVLSQCVGLDTSPKLIGTGLMQDIPGWFKPATNIAESLSNLWLTICDMRTAIQNIQTNCCSGLCESVDVTMSVGLSTTIDITFSGIIPFGFLECNPLGTLFTITGDGYTGTFTIPVVAFMNGTYSLPIPSTLNTAANFTISAILCLQQDTTTCERALQYTYVSTVACPTLTLTPSDNSITCLFNNVIGGTITYNIELFNSTGTTLLSNTNIVNPPLGSISSFFSSLTSGTAYQVRIRYSIDGGINFINCTASTVTTTTPSCASIDSIDPTPTITFTTT